tara:strand:- start:378 stop:563 length:186 start_codon:yes stop_codon:yes gene_type:complete
LGSNGGFEAEYLNAPLGLDAGGGFFELLEVLVNSFLGEDVKAPFLCLFAALALRGVLPGDL